MRRPSLSVEQEICPPRLREHPGQYHAGLRDLFTAVGLNNGIVSIEAGARWAAVDEMVQLVGLAVTGGRSGLGGIGGPALAGVQ